MIHLNVHYCDEIIRHAENDKYSLIGIFTDECHIPTQQFILGRLCLSISFSAEGGYMQALQTQPTFLEIVRNDDVISEFEIPPYDGGGTGENVSFMLHQTVSGLPVSDGDRIYVRMKTHSHIISESHPLFFTWLPYHS
ncbi:hypothetical protein HMPREF9016_01191 [Neisseria sp. oral taxon 014 str. F0314]|uniref:Uncharacterized protein n=1 Tax=Neisseria oralis TaxID=1107316 RepID=A0ABW8Q6W7_9NEIS|nr:hypothetical protein [Neisseria sp. oral taxon 014]EFI22806.1 hypothetical protein HMPREF9016_01191 [Neisseria sp. oral taxon 014 str. F0314]